MTALSQPTTPLPRRRRDRRRLHHPHQRRRGRATRDRRRHRLPEQDLGARSRERAFKSPPGTLLYQDLNLAAARAARHGRRATRRRSGSTRAMQFDELLEFGREYTPARSTSSQHYAGERPLFDLFIDRGRDREGAGAARRPEVGRLPDHRPDRGDDDDRRQHRRLRRRAQLRRHDLQDQPRGGQAIARQLRLRNLGGIIIIDFIDMESDEHRGAGARRAEASSSRATARGSR